MLSKIRTAATVALTAAAALSAGVSPALSSAATVKTTPLTRVQTVTVAKKAPTAAIKSAGSAGVPGYGDSECESLLHDYNTAVDQSEQNLLNNAPSNQAGQLANQIYGQLTSNCMTID
jgi:hypothetical protein